MIKLWTTLWLLNVAVTSAFCSPIFSIQPVLSTVVPGDKLLLTIDITDVKDLAGFQFDFTFPQGVLSALSITEGSFLPKGGSTLFIPGTISNSAGLIASTADALIGAIPGVTGSGTVAILTLQDISTSIASLGLSNVLLLDSKGAQIVADVRGATVNAPEPTYTFVIGLSLLGGSVFLRRFRRRTGRCDEPAQRAYTR